MPTVTVARGAVSGRLSFNLVYFREEVGGLCMGGYERHPAPWSLDGIPADFNGKLLDALIVYKVNASLSIRRNKMYDNLIWWFLIMTPGVLSMTCFIWRMERRAASQVVSSKERNRK